jgi:hypothetical protein
MEVLLAFGAALLSFRLAGELAQGYRARRTADRLAWAAALGAYAIASAAVAWGSAAGWDDRAFRVYYLFGGLLTAPLLGAGSLLRAGVRAAGPAVLVYAGLAIGVAVSVPLTEPVSGSSIPAAQEHLELVPARLVAIVGNSIGTLAAAGVALLTIRRRPLGNALILAGLAVAAAGSGLAGLGVAATSTFVAAAALLLYLGFVAPSDLRALRAARVPNGSAKPSG